MTLKRTIEYIDGILKPSEFDDISNNGLQIARERQEIELVAFAVDASLKSVKAAAEIGADLLIVHHGISWGGGIKRITEANYAIIKTAIAADMALYASHLPLDANEKCGNNWEIAREMRLRDIERAFSYHGNVIGVIGYDENGDKIGICSGGAAEFAVEAKGKGCKRFITGEANWAETIAAENVGASLETIGHYESETYGVKALKRLIELELGVKTVFIEGK